MLEARIATEVAAAMRAAIETQVASAGAALQHTRVMSRADASDGVSASTRLCSVGGGADMCVGPGLVIV